jgi:hypothetical protein
MLGLGVVDDLAFRDDDTKPGLPQAVEFSQGDSQLL